VGNHREGQRGPRLKYDSVTSSGLGIGVTEAARRGVDTEHGDRQSGSWVMAAHQLAD
jgi:hypothetical protein